MPALVTLDTNFGVGEKNDVNDMVLYQDCLMAEGKRCVVNLSRNVNHTSWQMIVWGNNFWTIRANFEVQIESKKSRKKLKSEMKV